jgi:hypothetical protein
MQRYQLRVWYLKNTFVFCIVAQIKSTTFVPKTKVRDRRKKKMGLSYSPFHHLGHFIYLD